MKRIIYKTINVMAIFALTLLSSGYSTVNAQTNPSSKNVQNSNPSLNLLAAPPPPVGQTGNWELVFEDNFDGTKLDLTKWAANWYKEGGNMNKVGTYANNVSVADGVVTLTLESSSRGALINTQSNNGFEVMPGMYAEARVKFSGNGSKLYNWPAWWISGVPWPAPGEHDIAEVLGGNLTVNYHSPSGAHNQGAVSGYWGDQFHVYAIYRLQNKAEVYWDGKLVKSYTTDDNGKGEDLILNIGAGQYPMYGAAGAMQVDYVRVWKGASGAPVSSPTPVPATAMPTSAPPTATTVKLPTASPIAATPTPVLPTITASPTSLLPTAVPVSTQTAFVPSPTATQIIVNNPTAIPTFTAVPIPSDSFVSVSISPQSMVVGETGLAAVNLNKVPVQGYRSAEFTCTYPKDQLEISNILISNLFGPDPVSALNGPQNGSFIIAIAGSNGNRITVNGAVFTFNVKVLQAGQINIDCKARISKGDNSLEGISYVPATIDSLSNLPTATQLSAPVLSGQVVAAKPVLIRLFNLDSSLAAQANVNTDGTFSLTAPAGTYTVIASADGYLDAQGSVTLVDGVNTMMPLVNLPAGDIDNNDVIDQFDAMTIGMSYNASLPVAADLNSNDGVIDVLDLEVLSENYRKSGALSWQ